MNEHLSTPSFRNAPDTCEAVIGTIDCRVCMGAHDDEIHAATVAVRQWFRGEVTKSFEPLVLI
jgi:hypothetical protein